MESLHFSFSTMVVRFRGLSDRCRILTREQQNLKNEFLVSKLCRFFLSTVIFDISLNAPQSKMATLTLTPLILSATSESLTNVNWDQFLTIWDKINSETDLSREAVTAISKRLQASLSFQFRESCTNCRSVSNRSIDQPKCSC